MSRENTPIETRENLFTLLAAKFIPFWPLFVALFFLGLIGAKLYLSFTTPLYQSDAAMIVNDEKKGVDESQLMESINVFESKKIVENEIEVLMSKSIISDIVSELGLYAQIYESNFFSDRMVYSEAPVKILLQNPENENTYKDAEPVDFTYDSEKNEIIIDDENYALDTWIDNPAGGSNIKFVKNEEAPVSDQSDFYYLFKNPSAAAQQILGNLYVGAANKSSTVVKISYLDANPDRGNDIVNQLIKSYKKAAIADQNSLASNTLEFVETRMEQVGEQLQDVEKELQKYRSSEGVIDLSEQGSLYLQNVGDYDRRIADINLQLSVLDKVESYVVSKNKNTGIVPSTLGISDPILTQLLQRLYDAEIEYEQLRKTTAENNPILVAIRNRIEKIRPGILENVRNQKSSLRASRGNLTDSSGKYNNALDSLPEQERKYVEINRRKKSVSDLYDYLVQKREETALSYAPTAGNVRVIQEAEATPNPVKPKKLFAYAIGLFLTLGAGVAWVGGKELFNSKVLFRSELESRTNLPVLGELAFVDKPQDELLITRHKDVFIADQFRQVLSYLGVYDYKDPVQTIMVTSSIPGEGKSYVSANLALSIALTGKKTALVDMDLRKEGVSGIFNLENKPGISNMLTSELSPESIKHKEEGDLYIFPSGKKSLNSSELLTNKKLVQFFTDLKQEFDAIIIDSPPSGMVSDATLLAGFSDKIIMTVRHDHTPKFVANHLDENVNKKRFKNCSVVFNGVRARGIIKENYGYGYGYGYDFLEESINGNQKIINLSKLTSIQAAFKNFIQSIPFLKKK
ncbi:GumC family protein [Zobellia nedashkovskayae]|uniref:GumC family protein n=1 Tax=Zobellia nedashkovskayae TaxID=2779510 RepID=UPI001889F102|nr:polysaccharide biosynthesis tyrosine autokinase [Zobellia nedashkovskayae]